MNRDSKDFMMITTSMDHNGVRFKVYSKNENTIIYLEEKRDDMSDFRATEKSMKQIIIGVLTS